jgi:hypothetical protein
MEMKLKILIASFVILLASTACGVSFHLGDNAINGSGNRVTETREVSGFDEVLLAGSGELYLEQGAEESLTVTADDNIMQYLKTDVEGDTLVLGFKDNVNVSLRTPVVFKLTVRDLTSVTLAGSGKVVAQPLDTTKLTINLPGSGEMRFEKVETGSLHATIAGSGTIEVESGSAESEEINMVGSGDFKGKDFKVTDASTIIAGSGNIDVNCNGELNAKILGSGNVRYYGDPTSVKLDTAGSGEIQKMGN